MPVRVYNLRWNLFRVFSFCKMCRWCHRMHCINKYASNLSPMNEYRKQNTNVTITIFSKTVI